MKDRIREATSSAKPADQSRRKFLKALAAAGATAAVPVHQAQASKTEELVTLFDLSRCVGCGECVEACHDANGEKYPKPEKPFPKMYPNRVKVADWSDKQDVDDRLTPYNWLYIQNAEIEHNGESLEVNIPRRCMHCQNPPCANLCPWGAARKQDNGIVRIDSDICLGGAKCKTVCPWKIPQRQTGVGIYKKIMPGFAGNGVMYKCSRCYDRVAQGLKPACLEACPEDVQTIGPRSEMVSRAHELAAEMNGYIYGENENGGTNTIYVSPVPFDKLNAAIDKDAKKGRPHLAPVSNSMKKAENMTWAILAAPVAGIAAGILKTGAHFTKGKPDQKTSDQTANSNNQEGVDHE